MGKFDGILICTDLDGTLLRGDKSVSHENLEAIEYFKSKGGYFTFITGRMPYFVGDILEKVKINAPFGCINGGGLYDPEKNEYIWKMPIRDDVRELVKYVAENTEDLGIQYNLFDRLLFAGENETMVHFRRITGVPNLTCSIDGPDEILAKVLFGDHREERLMKVKALLDAHPRYADFDYIRSEHSLYEILPKGISKGAVLPRLAEYLKIDMRHTVAVGDYNNDISMLKAAEVGIAVSNATDETKAAADLVTVSNEEHAIAKIIYDIENENISF